MKQQWTSTCRVRSRSWEPNWKNNRTEGDVVDAQQVADFRQQNLEVCSVPFLLLTFHYHYIFAVFCKHSSQKLDRLHNSLTQLKMDFPKTSNLNFVWTQTLNFLLSVFFSSLFRTAHQISPFCVGDGSRVASFTKPSFHLFPTQQSVFVFFFSHNERRCQRCLHIRVRSLNEIILCFHQNELPLVVAFLLVSSLPMPETDSMKLELQLWERKTMNSPKQVRFYGNRSISSWESTALTRHEPESKTRQRMTNDGRVFAWGQILFFDCNFFKVFKACVPLLTGTCSSSVWDTRPS